MKSCCTARSRDSWTRLNSASAIDSRKAWCGRPTDALERRRRDSLTTERKGRQDSSAKPTRRAELGSRRAAQGVPADAFLGEEGGGQNARRQATWIIDPIDGTTNFIAASRCGASRSVLIGVSVLGIRPQPGDGRDLHRAGWIGRIPQRRAIRVSSAQRADEARMHSASAIAGRYRSTSRGHACLEASCEYARFGSGRWAWRSRRTAGSTVTTRRHFGTSPTWPGILVTEPGGWCNDFFGGPDAMAKVDFILRRRHRPWFPHCARAAIALI
jgi:hypothetical protein